MVDLKGKTLAKALRMRQNIAKKIAEAQNRATSEAVVEVGVETDFDVNEQFEAFSSLQADLREVKTRTALMSHTAKVFVPKEIAVAERGTEVPVYQAVLIRDDLKGKKALVDRILAVEAKPKRPRGFLGRGETTEIIEYERKFDFNLFVEIASRLQESIDVLDDAIQGVDATTRFTE